MSSKKQELGITLKISKDDILQALKDASPDERLFVVRELIYDGGDVWKLAQDEVKDSDVWHDWEKPSE